MIPDRILILLSGIPATRKSTFARYLSRERGFAHYDLECHPKGWPHPELKRIWDLDRKLFVDKLRSMHQRVVLDWGFPPICISWVQELRQSDVKLFWFDGDIPQARQSFMQREGTARIADFEQQVLEIQTAKYPFSLNCPVMHVLDSDGLFSDPINIEGRIFTEINE
jgi:hypothetical protein